MLKKNLFILIPVIILALAFSASSKWLIYDDAVTSANDSLESGWVKISGANIELFLAVDDTMRVDYYIDYRVATETNYLTTAADSLVTRGTALTGKGKGVVLRGQSTSGIVNIIPGAEFIRLRAYRHASSETTGSFHAGLNEY